MEIGAMIQVTTVSDSAASLRKVTKAQLADALAQAQRALLAEPGAYTTTEPVRVTVTIRV